MTDTGAKDFIQSDADAKQAGYSDADLWLKKIERQRDDEKDWRLEGNEAVEVYEAQKKAAVTFNLFYSNVETLIPAIYNSAPVPDVRRRFGDPDPIAKNVVDMSERALSYCQDQYDIDGVFTAMIRDGEVPGRGSIRLRYRPYMDGDTVGYQECNLELVPWDKVIIGPARVWEKVPWIAFEHDLTKEELKKLNPGKAADTQLGETQDRYSGDKDISRDPTGVLNTLKVYEIWDKAKGEVIFVDCKKEEWKREKDPLGLRQFFPMFKPFQPALRASSLVPICPFSVYKPLFYELDLVTKRISKLVRQLRVRGLYDSALKTDVALLQNCEDGQYVATGENSLAFANGGALDKAVAHWPMDPTVKALQQLYLQRDAIKQTIYEVTGIADILRGSSDPRETLGAQQIKQQWGSLRIQMLQKQVAEIARQVYRAKVDLFAKHYTDENLALMTSLPQTDEQKQIWQQVLQMFRSEMRSFKIDIETDSTVRADMTRNQEQMNQFLAGTGQFATAAAGLVQGMPDQLQVVLPAMVEVYTAFARKFKLGKQAEDALDQMSQNAQQFAQQPPQEKPDPEVKKAEMQMQAMQQKAQIDQQALQAKMAHEERMAQLAEQKARLDIEVKQIELQLKQQSAQIDAQVQMQTAAMDQQARQEEHAFAHQERAEEAEFNRKERHENHAMQREQNDMKRQGMVDKAKFDKQRMAQQAKARPQNGANA